jgi:DNA-binding CsgD family transcriptional regulator
VISCLRFGQVRKYYARVKDRCATFFNLSARIAQVGKCSKTKYHRDVVFTSRVQLQFLPITAAATYAILSTRHWLDDAASVGRRLSVIACIPCVYTIPLPGGTESGMSIRENQESELLDVLYSAAADPAFWNEFLACLARLLDAPTTGFVSHDSSSKRNCLDLQFGMSTDTARLYAEYYGTMDPWFHGYKRKNLCGWIGLGSDLCPPSEFQRTEYCADFSDRRDLFYQCGAIIEQSDGGLTVLTALRGRRRSDFDTTHVRFLKKIHPHLTRALDLHGKMLHLKHAASAAGSIVDTLDVALIGLDGDGRVCFANGLAESLLRSAEILRVHDGRIVAHDSREAVALDRLLKAASAPNMSSGAAGALTVHKGDRSLHLAVLPFRASAYFFPERLKVFLTITDPDAAPKSRAQLLTKLFRLTPAETRVAMLLVAGMELNEIATRTRTTSHTVRSHLKSIYHKTGATRQSQLMRLISRLPGQP